MQTRNEPGHCRIVDATDPTSGTLARAAITQIGSIECITLYDGYADLPVTIFDGPDAAAFGPVLQNAGMSGAWLRTDILCFAIRHAGRVILIDTGMGTANGPTSGHLLESLALADIQAADVQDIILTHLHRDHAGGLACANDTQKFSNAVIHVNPQEFFYWTSDTERLAAPAHQRHFDVAARAMASYADHIALFPHAHMDLTPHLSIRHLPGHTCGHTGVVFRMDSDEILFWGDTIHCAVLQLAFPDTTVSFDSDQVMAAATRKTVLHECLHQPDRWIAGAHLPFPGIGKIVPDGENTYRFKPLPAQVAHDERATGMGSTRFIHR